jgi:hypothetical protein
MVLHMKSFSILIEITVVTLVRIIIDSPTYIHQFGLNMAFLLNTKR